MTEAVDGTFLKPNRRLRTRLVILGALTILAAIANASYHVAFFSVTMALWLGTFPRVCLSDQHLQREYLVMFFSARVQRWPLSRFVAIETGLEQRFGIEAGCLAGLVLGFHNVVLARILDWMIPWAGGDYKIWLRSASGKRVLVWQGNNEDTFRDNLDTLEDLLDLPVERR